MRSKRISMALTDTSKFLSSNTQDFIEVIDNMTEVVRDHRFLSSNTQDFIEVGKA